MDLPVYSKICGGAHAVVVWDSQDATPKPLIGAFFSPERGWLPCSWTREGLYHIDPNRQQEFCNLDLVWVRENETVDAA